MSSSRQEGRFCEPLPGGGLDLRELDGIAVKKIGETYSTDLLDRLDMLRLRLD